MYLQYDLHEHLKKQSTSGIPVPVCSGREAAQNTSIPMLNKDTFIRNRFNSCCQMTQLNEWHLQIGLCRNLKEIHNGCLIFCGQMRLIFNCMKQLTHKTVESGQKRTPTRTTCNDLVWFYILYLLIKMTNWIPFLYAMLFCNE